MDMMQLDLFAFAAVQAKKEIETASRMDESIPKIDAKHTPVILRNFLNDGRHVMPTTPAARIEANLKAIRLLKELRAGERVPSHEEQITLSQFSGWGGLTEVFMESSRYFQDVRNLLSEEEYQTAQNSILDSYYTPEYIIDFMWDIVAKA